MVTYCIGCGFYEDKKKNTAEPLQWPGHCTKFDIGRNPHSIACQKAIEKDEPKGTV